MSTSHLQTALDAVDSIVSGKAPAKKKAAARQKPSVKKTSIGKKKVQTKTIVNAGKEKLQKKDALALAKGMSHLYAAKGKKVVHYDLKKDKPSQADLLKVMLGPTGNLRAPTWKKGKTLVVGFHAETYADLLT